MFSPDATLHGSLSLRNPRRRHRTTSEDSFATRQSNKRRKRSSLAPDTFDSPSSSKVNGYLSHANGTLKDSTPEHFHHRDASVETTSLAVRSRGSRRDKRIRKDDGTTQAKSDHYVVTKEFNLPSTLQELLGKEAWQGSFSPGLGYAVAVSHTQAIVWAHAPKNKTVDSTKPYIIKLPYQATNRNSRDPLPLATLVHDAGVGELALMVCMPNGKLVYWESVPSAASSDVIRQKQQGLQGSVGGMFGSETVTDLTEAEPDGFILTSSVGRIIHLSVRDPQGRPALSVHYLKSSGNSNGGLLGSFKSVFSSSWKRDIAAVRPGPLRGKNNRHCIAANVQGQFQVWDLARHGPQNLELEHDAKDEILRNIHNVDLAMNDNYLDLRLLDFTIFPKAKGEAGDNEKLLVLTVLTSSTKNHYFLLDLTLRKERVDVNVVYPVTCWNEPPGVGSDWPAFKPRVLLPSPAHTAFLVFDTYLILVSLGKIEQSADSQLQLESQSLSEPYQDILFINRDNFDHFVGCTAEISERETEEATILLLANTFGLARATAYPSVEDVSVYQRRAAMCKSRIELAVFFGHGQSNLFDLRYGLSAVDWTKEEIETATKEVSDDVLNNQSSYIPSIVPSMEHQLKLRAAALADLIKSVGKYALSVSLRWELLWSAEKIAAARAVWLTYNETLTKKHASDMVLLPELIDMISERNKHENRPELGETDIVRHFLVHDASRMDLIIIWAQYSLEKLYEEGPFSQSQQAKLTSQANNIQIAALDAAFGFRQSNAELYGLGTDIVEDGIFQGDYNKVPREFWTSAKLVVEKIKQQCDVARVVAINNAESPEDEEVDITQDLMIKLNLDNPKLVHLSCKVFDERIRFLKSRSDEQDQAQASELDEAWTEFRRDLIIGLTALGLVDDAFRLAEHYRDMTALAEVFGIFEQECADELARPGIMNEEEIAVKKRVIENTKRLERYFRTYGSRWATAMYDRKLRGGELFGLLIEEPEYHSFLTQYLRDKPDVSAFTWMHEVGQGDYKMAAESLVQASKDETGLWEKKVEFSLAKLSIMAAAEKNQVDETTLMKTTRKSDRRVRILGVQEMLYNFLRPQMKQAIDEAAAVDLIMEAWGVFVKDKPFLQGLLRKHLQVIVSFKSLGAEDLIDVLTLMGDGSKTSWDDGSFTQSRYFYALRLIDYGGFSGERKTLHLKTVWRRCLLQDDWVEFNRTEKKDEKSVADATEDTVFFQTLKQGFKKNILEASPPLPPSELLGTGVDVESLRRSTRYAQTPDSFLKPLSHDHALEDKALQEAIGRGRLEDWWPGIVEAAQTAVRREADEAGEMAALLQAETLEQEEEPANGDGDLAMS